MVFTKILSLFTDNDRETFFQQVSYKLCPRTTLFLVVTPMNHLKLSPQGVPKGFLHLRHMNRRGYSSTVWGAMGSKTEEDSLYHVLH